MTRFQTVVLFMLVLLGACNNTNFSGGGAQDKDEKRTLSNMNPLSEEQGTVKTEFLRSKSEVFQGNDVKKLDVIFLFDGSESMEEERQKLTDNLEDFITDVKKTRVDLDVELFLVGFGFDSFANSLTVINQEVGSKDALIIFKDIALGAASPFREDAIKELVVISDDNSSYTAREFKSLINSEPAFKRGIRVSGFVGTNRSRQSDWCRLASPGFVYSDLADDREVGGFINDVCQEDWGSLMTDLSRNLGTPEKNLLLKLEGDPELTKPVEVFYNSKPVPETSFSIKEVPGHLKLYGYGKMGPNDVVEVSYIPRQ